MRQNLNGTAEAGYNATGLAHNSNCDACRASRKFGPFWGRYSHAKVSDEWEVNMNDSNRRKSLDAYRYYYARFYDAVEQGHELECKQFIARIYREMAELEERLRAAEAKHNYNPNEPRVPAGNSGGGRWGSDASPTPI